MAADEPPFNSQNMSARFTLSEAEHKRGHTERSPLTQACVDAVRDLIAAGGTGNVEGCTYEFRGPATHVRNVVSAYMEFLRDAE